MGPPPSQVCHDNLVLVLAPSELHVLGVGFCLSSVTVALHTQEKVLSPELIVTHFPAQ